MTGMVGWPLRRMEEPLTVRVWPEGEVGVPRWKAEVGVGVGGVGRVMSMGAAWVMSAVRAVARQ
ncbi:MAG TPA: hypothetical protein VHQ47_20785 [Phycisphaerae bacterium]|nr:hypothetical protein [Phycisphaerae bacterium]